MKTVLIIFLVIWLNIQTVSGTDRAINYYYPASNNIETYKGRMRVNIDTSRPLRENIINLISKEFLNKLYPGKVVIFSKDKRVEKIIIVSLVEGYLDTTYRARAFLEAMAPVVRRSPLLKDIKRELNANLFDLLKISGFKKIIVSDGKKFSYQVSLR